MTKKVVTKHDNSESTKCECGCGCDKGACTCGCNGAKGFIVVGTALSLALSIAALATSCSVSQSFDSKADAYVDGNAEKIIASVDKYYNKKEEEKRTASTEEIVARIVADKTNYSLGNPEGTFVIVEFFDYNCGWCKRTNGAIAEALKKPEAKNIRWIPIDTPIFGASSETISRYVLAAGKQGKYAALHDAVATGNDAFSLASTKVATAVKAFMDKNKLTDGRDPKVQDYSNKVAAEEYGKAMESIAKGLGIDVSKLKKDANGSEIKGKLADNRKYSQALNINGVPMLIVNGKVHEGALLGEALDAAVAESAK